MRYKNIIEATFISRPNRFIAQVEVGGKEVRPNDKTHPEFGVALQEAKKAGVKVLFLKCHVEKDLLEIIN